MGHRGRRDRGVLDRGILRYWSFSATYSGLDGHSNPMVIPTRVSTPDPQLCVGIWENCYLDRSERPGIRFLEMALEPDPRNQEALEVLRWAHLRRQDHDQAVEQS